MKIVFDEAGNTGCVVSRKNMLTFQNQPIFSLCAVVLPDIVEEEVLIEKYQTFLSRHNINSEIKGSELMKRENNIILFDFIENVMDDKHFILNIYDKKFYLASLICLGIMGSEFHLDFVTEFYTEVSALSLEDDILFVSYLELIKDISINSLHNFLLFLKQYKFRYLNKTNQFLLAFIEKILTENVEYTYLSNFMTYGWYEDKSKTNIVNLTALGELIEVIKKKNANLKNIGIKFIHDKNSEFESTFENELSALGIAISFEDSKDNLLIQVADNVVSIVNKAYSEMRKAFQSKTEWSETSEWIMELTASIFRKLSFNSVKFTIPIADWSAALCVAEMFAPGYPKNKRKNIYFNPLYSQKQQQIFLDLITSAEQERAMEDSLDNLRR